ncbi:daunorubicin resistance ABC transporter ATPase subunit [Methanoregula boonei 6A8]|uniref:Daunorubicin resistance ABC transporter ATPase subunit n=1 Tax=Methanoregula boonei (strain DSM 21154 / JCM 14090 / 6A8) TaxID=456442 RepID=A7I5Y9_METB6|nr:daunorubicin resistance protein DrrA family ABC transporter ATP-binding protein [Methanoregula boonei]ABS55150.1 daunorubicin resistance ABC transporter ATPase subunit [Methanoregula boonei 6A8]
MHAIEVSHLKKTFGTLTALNDISFCVEEGETFGFLGPNGAGKTTTIRILTGISYPTAGTASIFGHDIGRETIAARQSMGIVSETSNVYDDLTAWQNMIFSAELYHVSREVREKKAKELLTTFDLYERRNDKARGFSKGMKRRLTIAMGLVNSPRLLFLDEPTSGLDVQSNLIIRDVVTGLIGEGVTVFLTTHNIEEANMMCDRVGIVNRGTIAAIDAPERLKKTIQSVQSIVLSFDRTAAGQLDDLHHLAMVNDAVKEGDKFRLYTEDPATVIEAVMEYARAGGLRVLSISTLGPSLEDVFIKLTGLQRTGGVVHAID